MIELFLRLPQTRAFKGAQSLQHFRPCVGRAGKELLHPILLDLNVPQFAKSMEDLPGISLGLVPAGAWIGIGKRVGHRPRSSEGYAEIMDVGDVPGLAEFLSALQDPFHPLL